jgi:hypothetical protein
MHTLQKGTRPPSGPDRKSDATLTIQISPNCQRSVDRLRTCSEQAIRQVVALTANLPLLVQLSCRAGLNEQEAGRSCTLLSPDHSWGTSNNTKFRQAVKGGISRKNRLFGAASLTAEREF